MGRRERIDLLLKDVPIPPETSDDRILEKAYTIPWFASDYDKDEESPPVHDLSGKAPK